MFATQASLLALLAAQALGTPTTLGGTNDNAKHIMRRSVTPSSEGTNNGFFYSIWSDGSGEVDYTNGPGGEYSLTWSNAPSGDVAGGKGWKTGAPRNITYTATYEPTGISFLSIYGWFSSPLVEYYIVENYGSGSPAGGPDMTLRGSLTSDGSVYDVYSHRQIASASIEGVTDFDQLWSIRRDVRQAGTVNTANHYDYWKSVGLPSGEFHYQILSTEGVRSSGSSKVTVSEGVAVGPVAAAAAEPKKHVEKPKPVEQAQPKAPAKVEAASADVKKPAPQQPAPASAASSAAATTSVTTPASTDTSKAQPEDSIAQVSDQTPKEKQQPVKGSAAQHAEGRKGHHKHHHKHHHGQHQRMGGMAEEQEWRAGQHQGKQQKAQQGKESHPRPAAGTSEDSCEKDNKAT